MPPRLAKVLALVAAIGMVGAALWINGRGDDGGSDDPDEPDREGPVTIACVFDLADLCEAISAEAGDDVEINFFEAADTAATLTTAEAGEPPIDAWLTLGPWPAMVDAQRDFGNRSALFDGDALTTLATSPLAGLGFGDALAEAQCPAVDWECLAGIAADGTTKVGIPPSESALGVLVAAQATAAHLGTIDFAANDFDSAYRLWLDPLVADTDRPGSEQQADLMVQQGQGSYGAIGTTAAINAIADTPRGRQQGLAKLPLEPAIRADVVLATLVGGDQAERARDLLNGKTAHDSLTQAGWVLGDPKTPDGLPDADVLVALLKEI